MPSTAEEILRLYWGYSTFRPLQKEIIESILTGNDTLAVLPTGAGKSICYHVPGMMKEGLSIVISPLIALMKDQVENLQQRNIAAAAIFSGMTQREIDATLDNAVFGKYRFLYVSPERLETDLFKERFSRMKIGIVAVDEAHCISQWGYDFRPSYLQIANLRKFQPSINYIALTGSATQRVRDDIVTSLEFKPKHKVYIQSFDRHNLVYAITQDEDKWGRLLSICKKVSGTGLVYVPSRKLAVDAAQLLLSKGFSASYYHAGLNFEERSARQESWKRGETRIMVCTNAFGMGIDKPDVRFVVHLEMPDSLESYYQEAGRAGRDLKGSFAIVLVSEKTRQQLQEKFEKAFPSIEEIKHVYHGLGNYFQLAEGTGQGLSFDFDLKEFCKRFALEPVTALNSIRILREEGYFEYTEAVFVPSRLKIISDNTDLYRFEVTNKGFEPLIKVILRTYGGCFDNYVSIDERKMANRLSEPVSQVVKKLRELQQLELIDYAPKKSEPQVTFLTERVNKKFLSLDHKRLSERKKAAEERLAAAILYAFSNNICRCKILLGYFGERTVNDCGHCDYCLKKNKTSSLHEKIKVALQKGSLGLEEIITAFSTYGRADTIEALRWLNDKGMIRCDDGNNYSMPG